MCRWFAYISDDEPCLLEDVLIVPVHSLAKQVHSHYLPYLFAYEPDATAKDTRAEIEMRNRVFNADGLGMAWYNKTRSDYGEATGPRQTVYKSLSQPLNDPSFSSICANISTRILFAHIRAASPGSPVHIYNNHPFTFGRYTFMHNGTVSNFAQIKREVMECMSEKVAERIIGTSDTEAMAGLFFTFLEEGKGPDALDNVHPLTDVKQALERAITTIIDIQKRVLPTKNVDFTASSLNIAITDGVQLLTIRFRNSETEHPPSLYYSTAAGKTLNRKYPGHPNEGVQHMGTIADAGEHGNHVIIASEPSTYQEHEWVLIEKNKCLMVEKNMEIRIEAVNVQF